jgi:hypothetical protein
LQSNYLDDSKLDDLQILTKKYADAKEELFKTRHATLAAQKLMKDLANIHETNPAHLQRVLQSSSLGSKLVSIQCCNRISELPIMHHHQ